MSIENRLREFAQELLCPPLSDQGRLSDALHDVGFSGPTCEALASLFMDVHQLLQRRDLSEAFRGLRGCVWGEALFRELAGDDDGETVAEACRRLHCSPRALRRVREQIRKLTNHVPPPAMIRPV